MSAMAASMIAFSFSVDGARNFLVSCSKCRTEMRVLFAIAAIAFMLPFAEARGSSGLRRLRLCDAAGAQDLGHLLDLVGVVPRLVGCEHVPGQEVPDMKTVDRASPH